MQSETLRRTPLYDQHVKLGGKIVPFAGWELPVQYSGVIAEHRAVREKAGLFDVSHMGEVIVTGAEAEKAIDYLTCNDVKTLTDGKALYSAIIDENGGVVDDIIIYRFNKERFLICVNASNADKDFEWFTSHNKFQAKFENKSASYGQIALQGPAAMEVLRTFPELRAAIDLKPFHFVECDLLSVPVIVARTGYTGEDGVEIFIPSNSTSDVWQALLENGEKLGLIPAGLGARDSLRLEACYPLHGHELGDDISAIESGLGWIVKFDKGDFFGRQALMRYREQSPRSLVGFFVDDPGIARHGDKLYSSDGAEIGITTSGTRTPTIDRALGMGLVKSEFAKVGTEILAEVRGKKLKCHVVKKPFYKRSN
jgi:aminomethyltransferase